VQEVHGEQRDIDADLVLLAPPGVEPRARPEGSAAEHGLPAAHQHGVLQRGAGPGPLVRDLLAIALQRGAGPGPLVAVAEEEDHLAVARQRDVEPRGGLRAAAARRELGGAEVPEHVDADAAGEVERLAALLAPERPRLVELHLVGDLAVLRRVDDGSEMVKDDWLLMRLLGPRGGETSRAAPWILARYTDTVEHGGALLQTVAESSSGRPPLLPCHSSLLLNGSSDFERLCVLHHHWKMTRSTPRCC
jgi:hypothetical protein